MSKIGNTISISSIIVLLLFGSLQLVLYISRFMAGSYDKEGIEKGNVVAIGKYGLDYDRLHLCRYEIQKKYFEKQLELAYATKLFDFSLNLEDKVLSKGKGNLMTSIARDFFTDDISPIPSVTPLATAKC